VTVGRPAVTKIFLAEIERFLLTASGVTAVADTPSVSRPRLGGISFLHRFGSALNHHVHLHACVTDGVFVPAAAEAGCGAPPEFLPARPITRVHLASITERVRRHVIRWFRLSRLLDAAAAADMLAWENSGFSIDASVRITLIDRDATSYFQSLEHLLRYYLIPQPRKHRHRYHGVFALNHPLRPAVTALAVGKHRDAATGGHNAEDCCGTYAKPRSHDTSRIAWANLVARVGEEFPLQCPSCGGDIRLISFITEPGPIRKILTHMVLHTKWRTARTAADLSRAGRLPTGANSCRSMTTGQSFKRRPTSCR
jgi:hypothetical protein